MIPIIYDTAGHWSKIANFSYPMYCTFGTFGGATLLEFHKWLEVGWEIDIPFQHKNRLYLGQGLGWN